VGRSRRQLPASREPTSCPVTGPVTRISPSPYRDTTNRNHIWPVTSPFFPGSAHGFQLAASTSRGIIIFSLSLAGPHLVLLVAFRPDACQFGTHSRTLDCVRRNRWQRVDSEDIALCFICSCYHTPGTILRWPSVTFSPCSPFFSVGRDDRRSLRFWLMTVMNFPDILDR